MVGYPWDLMKRRQILFTSLPREIILAIPGSVLPPQKSGLAQAFWEAKLSFPDKDLPRPVHAASIKTGKQRNGGPKAVVLSLPNSVTLLFLLLHHNCHFATVMNHNVEIWVL